MRPLMGCAALLIVTGTFIYANADHREYYQSNHGDGLKNDCSFTNEDYAFTMVYCGHELAESVFVCNYYLSPTKQRQCAQISSTYGVCGDKSGELELIHVCYL